MKLSITRKEAKELFDGILAGDGDIYGRMVNSEHAIPTYPAGTELVVDLLYKSLNPDSEYYKKGRSIANSFLNSFTFADD